MHTNRELTSPGRGLPTELPGPVMNEVRISLDTLGKIEPIVSDCLAGRMERAAEFAGTLGGEQAPPTESASPNRASVPTVSIVQSKPGPMAAPHSSILQQPTGQGRYYFLGSPEPVLAPETESQGFDAEGVRADFPALHQDVNGKPLVWLDNAATTQKPNAVIDAVAEFYRRDNSNVHRAAHTLAKRATQAYENARMKVRDLLGARSEREIVFVRGTTEAINLVSNSFGRANIGAGDEILITTMEHHANIVPWQMLAQQTGATLRAVPIDDRGELLLDEFAKMLSPKTRLVAVTQVSNVLGTVNPISLISGMVHAVGARLLVDGAQSVPHMPVDVHQLGCDFFVFSGHKLFGPTGIGVLYGREELLSSMPPWQGGGNMIQHVTVEESTYNDIPHKFEAGTGNLADAVGLGAVIDYLSKLDMKAADAHERSLLQNATAAISGIPGLRVIGTAADKVSVLSFVADGVKPEDLAAYLDQEGIAVRAGHHCAQPTLKRFGLEATVRASFAFYNTMHEVGRFAEAVAAGVRALR